jgi:hypothetical protein
MMPVAMRTFLNPERVLGPEQRHRIEWEAPVVAGVRPSGVRMREGVFSRVGRRLCG